MNDNVYSATASSPAGDRLPLLSRLDRPHGHDQAVIPTDNLVVANLIHYISPPFEYSIPNTFQQPNSS
jgi:hypothetical protein